MATLFKSLTFGFDVSLGGNAGIRFDSSQGVVKIHIPSVVFNASDHVCLNSFLGCVLFVLVLVIEKSSVVHLQINYKINDCFQ